MRRIYELRASTLVIESGTDKAGFPVYWAEVFTSDLTRRRYVTFAYRNRDRAVLEGELWIKNNPRPPDIA